MANFPKNVLMKENGKCININAMTYDSPVEDSSVEMQLRKIIQKYLVNSSGNFLVAQ